MDIYIDGILICSGITKYWIKNQCSYRAYKKMIIVILYHYNTSQANITDIISLLVIILTVNSYQ